MTTTAPQQQAEAEGDPASLPLLERIGGIGCVEWVVDRFVDELRKDRQLAPALAGVDFESLKTAQTAFFTAALGGHVPDGSVDSRTVHIHLEAEQFLRVVLCLHDTLVSLDLSDELHEKLVLAVAAHALPPGLSS